MKVSANDLIQIFVVMQPCDFLRREGMYLLRFDELLLHIRYDRFLLVQLGELPPDVNSSPAQKT
ncbi:hypothetical protein D3C72_2292580 [compost metagenome]